MWPLAKFKETVLPKNVIILSFCYSKPISISFYVEHTKQSKKTKTNVEMWSVSTLDPIDFHCIDTFFFFLKILFCIPQKVTIVIFGWIGENVSIQNKKYFPNMASNENLFTLVLFQT